MNLAQVSLLEQEWALPIGLFAVFGALFVLGLYFTTHREDGSAFARLRETLHRRPPNPARSLSSIAEHASDIAEKSLERSGRRGGLEQTLERAGINMRPGEFLMICVAACFAAFAIGALLGGLLVAIILAAVVYGCARFSLTIFAERRRAKFESQLEQTLPLMAGSLRAGFGIMQAFDAVARDSEAPTADEFRRLVMESRLGRDVSESLDALAERVKSEDFEFVVQAIEIHRQVGGDLAEVLDQVATTIRDRNRVRRQIETLTAEGRMSGGILFALPLVMFVVIQIINPRYMHELTSTTFGKGLLLAGGLLILVGGVWMRRLIRLVF
jgi:tight adherence protein B